MCCFFLRNCRRIPVFIVCCKKMVRSEIHRPRLRIQIRNPSPSWCPSSSSRYIQHRTSNPSYVITSSQPPPCTLYGAVTPSTCSLNPKTVAPKPIHKSLRTGPRALMESWPGPRNLSGSSSTTTSTAGANMSTSPSALPTNSLPTSSMLALPTLPMTTMTQYIPCGPSAMRDLERWPNTMKDLDRLMETYERDRDRDRERERERGRDRDRG